MTLPLADFLRTVPQGIVFATVYLTDAAGDPLLLKSTYDPEVWQLPGGLPEAGEDPWAAARRELAEETELELPEQPAAPLLALVFTPPVAGWPFRVGVVFDGGPLAPDRLAGLRLDPAEHSAHAVRPLADWRAELSPTRLALVEAAAEARRTGRAGYRALVAPPAAAPGPRDVGDTR
ncbi:NUDIX domain-containing protein [Kitasatospora sp. LaBMicrA B282]|uniref:NUDIX domain-containing protein n=1 Tax=Kitasatospora sp. LaBMicrA B282 TaxID=3420949 RepID=UPI003D14810C